KQRVTIYDTTLRDGTQGEGISFSVLDKIRVAEKLDAFGVDYIEGGWPGSNPKDIAFFQEAKKRHWTKAKIAAFGSTRRGNLAVEKDPQVQTLLEADTPVVTLVGKSWLLHVREVLNVTPEENCAMIGDTVRFFKKAGREVIYDAEHFFDGYKDDAAHALRTLEAARDAGADLLVLCDTNGGSLPEDIYGATAEVIAKIGPLVGIHTHDDCGVGVANALAAVRAGAVQIQGTINGYGERVGNCNLTTVIPNLQLKMGIEIGPEVSKLRELSLFVDELANCAHNTRAPYVGSSAFAHKGGIHANAVQKIARSYEHIDPSEVGNRQHILVSELSGQSNILLKARELGFTLDKGSPEVAEILREVKRLENQGYEFEAAEASFDLLIRKVLQHHRPAFELLEYHCTFRRSGSQADNDCEATLKIRVGEKDEYTVAEGDGPINALDSALRKALRPSFPQIDEIELEDYKVRIVDSEHGTAARTRVLIVSTDHHSSWGTVGVSDNLIEASWLALVDSFEYKLLPRESQGNPAAGLNAA
ncbi:MAG: citramalate synthase, partial [Verrucomicrobiota bacterium]|nr:citramalate synthase [Verrucomicrobiota bacterium]